jgi:hypothetical protein
MATNPEPTKPTSTPSSPLAGAGLAIALYIAVIDAAVETFLSGSPVRWWVAGVVAAYLALSVGLWRYRRPLWQRMGWSARVSASFFLLLGLLAFTVWLPGGLTDGIRVVGQSTSRLLTLFTTVVIVLAGVSLMRLSWLPRWAKVVAGLLAAYGFAAFVKGIVTGAEFAALLKGDSLWARLPSQLQGAFLGALVVVPAGLLLHAVRMLKAAPGVSRAWDLRQGIAMAMSVLMAASGVTSSGLAAPGDVPALKKQLRAYINPKDLPARIDDLAKMDTAIRPPNSDVGARATAFGPNVDATFAFVRDQVRYEAYEGVLRGPRGTLMAKAGNAFDKALLLSELLTRNGITTRFVRGKLSNEQAQILFKQMFLPTEKVETAVSQGKVPPWLDAQANMFVKVVFANWALNTERVSRALSERKIQLPNRLPISDNALLDEIANHVWLDYKKGDQWIALDPTFAQAKPGQSFTGAESNSAELPESGFHRVTISLKAEQGGQPRDLLRYDSTAADLDGAQTTLAFNLSANPLGWSAKPVLLVDGKENLGSAVSGGTTGAIQGLASSLFARPGQPPVRSDNSVTAIWLDFDFHYPSGRMESVRRQIFGDNLVPTTGGRAQPPASSSSEIDAKLRNSLGQVFAFSFASGRLDPGFMFEKMKPSLVQLPPLLRAQGSGQMSDEQKVRLQQLVPSMLYMLAAGFHLYSQTFLIAAQGQHAVGAVTIYSDSPRLAIVSIDPTADQTDSGSAALAIDLRRNLMRVTSQNLSAPEAIAANVSRGIADAVLEDAMLVGPTDDKGSSAHAISTLQVLDLAQGQHVPLMVLTEKGEVDKIDAAAQAKAWMADIDPQALLIAPQRAVAYGKSQRIGWWDINLKSGETLALMDSGLHQATEELISYEDALFWFFFGPVLMQCIGLFAGAIVADYVLWDLVDPLRQWGKGPTHPRHTGNQNGTWPPAPPSDYRNRRRNEPP